MKGQTGTIRGQQVQDPIVGALPVQPGAPAGIQTVGSGIDVDGPVRRPCHCRARTRGPERITGTERNTFGAARVTGFAVGTGLGCFCVCGTERIDGTHGTLCGSCSRGSVKAVGATRTRTITPTSTVGCVVQTLVLFMPLYIIIGSCPPHGPVSGTIIVFMT